MPENNGQQFEQPPSSLLVVIDLQTGMPSFKLNPPFPPAIMNNALDMVKTILIGQQIQALQQRQEQTVKQAPAGMRVQRNPLAT